MFTDGLVERRAQDIDIGLALLRETLSRAAPSPWTRRWVW